MEDNQIEILEKKLAQAFTIVLCIHFLGALVLGVLMYFEPIGYKKIGLTCTILALASSIYIANFHWKPNFYAERQLGQFQASRAKGAVRKFNEIFFLFVFPYTFWGSCIALFAV